MSDKYTTEQIGKESDTLYNTGKLVEAFTIAETGAIAYVEEVSGKKFIIMTLAKFDELTEKGILGDE